MKTILVACETIEDEIKAAIDRLKLDYRVVWVEGGLHNSPDRLRQHIQGILDEADGLCDRLIFTLGHCGGGVNNIATGDYQTILPLADDCISLLLGSLSTRKRLSSPPTFFLTSGWMRHENNVVTSYERSVEKYGPERAARLNKMMLKHYKRFGLVDTGTYDMQKAASRVSQLAELTGLETETLPADSAWIDQLLMGSYDDPAKFIVLPPHSQLGFESWQGLLEQG